MVADPGWVVGLHRSAKHGFSKLSVDEIDLRQGYGVVGDAHAGVKVQHLHRVRQDADQPNLRQVHLMHAELFAELAADGYTVAPGDLGENITTIGVDLLGLPVGTRIHLGHTVLTLTGLRNPCVQIEQFAPGLLKRLVAREDGQTRLLAGVMSVVTRGGKVTADDEIRVELPTGPFRPLERV